MKKITSGTMLILLMLGVLASAFDIQPAEAATIIVPEDYHTIQAAVNAARGGDTVFVKSGTYNENVVVRKSLTIIGENASTTIVDGNRNSACFVVQANNVGIIGFTIRNSAHESPGIFLSSSNNNVSFNIVTNNYWGVRLLGTSKNVIYGNVVTHTSYHGIYLHEASQNKILNNNITANEDCGIRLIGSSNYNDIYNNDIGDNKAFGIYVHGSINNTIHGNDILNNAHGIRFYSSSNNSVYHNNFLDNAIAASNHDSRNVWDNGYPSGGNYWSHIPLYDNSHGFNENGYQREPGSDGIRDGAHTIDENNKDYYPLMNLWIPPPNIAITRIALSKTVIEQNCTLYIDVAVKNLGDFSETANLTIYVNTTIIDTLVNITLEKGKLTTISLTWNTTGFARGNYHISSYAWPVPGEIDLTDNTQVEGVTISILGDVNGDFKDDIFDVVIVATAFGVISADESWNANTDLNNDNAIDIFDIVLLANNFGKTA